MSEKKIDKVNTDEKLKVVETQNTEEEEVLTKEEADRLESVFFEDDEEVTLRDGKKYKIHPCTLKDTRKLMKLIKTVNVDAIVLNFIPNEDDEEGSGEDDLFDILLLAFKNYAHINREYIDNYVDLESARNIIEIMLGINGIKKSLQTT